MLNIHNTTLQFITSNSSNVFCETTHTHTHNMTSDHILERFAEMSEWIEFLRGSEFHLQIKIMNPSKPLWSQAHGWSSSDWCVISSGHDIRQQTAVEQSNQLWFINGDHQNNRQWSQVSTNRFMFHFTEQMVQLLSTQTTDKRQLHFRREQTSLIASRNKEEWQESSGVKHTNKQMNTTASNRWTPHTWMRFYT